LLLEDRDFVLAGVEHELRPIDQVGHCRRRDDDRSGLRGSRPVRRRQPR
jgi:hypothetical protein